MAKTTGPGAAALGLVAAAFLLAGCGGGEDSTAAGEGETTARAEATAPSNEAKQDKASEAKPSAKQGAKQKNSKIPLPEGEREPGITPRQRKKATTADITLQSPAFSSAAALPARFTCAGKNVSPPLQWQGLPAGASELVLLVLNLLPVNGALFFDWAVAGIAPETTEIEEGGLPAGAILGTNGFGRRAYGLCPPKRGKEERYIFMLYAIPKPLDPKPGFDPLALREEVLKEAGNVGLLATSYTRR